LIGFWQVRDPMATWYEILKLLYISHYKKIHKISAEPFHKRISVFIGDAHIVTRRNAIKYVLNSDGLISLNPIGKPRDGCVAIWIFQVLTFLWVEEVSDA